MGIQSRKVRLRRFTVAAVFVFGLGSPLSAQMTRQPDLLRAIEAYDAGELQQALDLLRAAPALLDSRDSAVRSLYTGLIRFAQGEATAARLAFANAVRTDPSIGLDPAVHSPARVAAFDAAKADVVAELRSAALAADRLGEPNASLDRWLVVRLAVPDDAEANRRIDEIESARRAAAAAQRAATVDTAAIPTAQPPPVPAAETAERPTTASPRYDPGRAFAMGLLVPGLGQFYTGRAARGVIALGAAGGALAAGLLSERLEVQCGSVPVNDVCPPADILDERTRRPYLAPAVAAAVGIAVIGAIDAMITARRSGGDAASPVSGNTEARILLPALSTGNGVLRAELLRIRFR